MAVKQKQLVKNDFKMTTETIDICQ